VLADRSERGHHQPEHPVAAVASTLGGSGLAQQRRALPATRGACAVAGALTVLAGCAGTAGAPAPQPASSPRIIAYLASWGVPAKGLRIADIPADRLTHIFYAFGHVAADGRAALGDPCVDTGECGTGDRLAAIAPGGNFAQLRLLKQRFPHLHVLISLGGWGGSQHFSDVAATPAARREFVSSTIDLFIRRFPDVFDGIDIDWEFPVAGGLSENSYRAEDRHNCTLLLGEFRKQLDELGNREGHRYELTIAASARPWEIANLEVADLARHLDWINVMTYDYHSVDTLAHFNAPLDAATGDPTPELNIAASMQVFLGAGIAPRQLALGIPFYGRGYGGVAPARDGLFQRADYQGAGEWGTGGIDYRLLVAKQPERHGFKRSWQAEAKVPWLYNPDTRVWISYDDSESVALKAEYARVRGLGGVMFWELGGDDGTLLRAVHRGLASARE
jgi:chitinase